MTCHNDLRNGLGGKQHFKLDGHKRVSWETWKAAQGDG